MDNNKSNNLDHNDETLFSQLGDNKYKDMPFELASNEILGDPYAKSSKNSNEGFKNEELRKKNVVVGVEEQMPIKEKSIPEDKDYSKAKKIALATIIAGGASLAVLAGFDDLMNPEYIFTTHPNFTPDTFGGFLERTPENISKFIDLFSGKVR